MEDNIKIKRRRWWLAGLLSFLVPGMGQVYNGQATKGLFFYFLLSTWGGMVLSLIYCLMKYPMSGSILGLLAFLFFISLAAFLLIIFESIRTAWKAGRDYAFQPYNKWYIYLVVIVVVSGVSQSATLAFRDNVLKAYNIPSRSMQHTLEPGDFVISNQLYYRYNNPKQGDLIIFKYPRDEKIDFVKRIVACPGDTIEIKDSQVFINGNKINEPYAFDAPTALKDMQPMKNFGPFVVPDNEYFVMGDNRNNSEDSRVWGTVPRHNIEGKVIFIYFSWDREIPAWNIISRLLSIRLSRIGEIIK
jgi:signal peptidase I